MEWRDTGFVLGTRRHGETSVVLEVMTQAHGRHVGMVRGGRSRRMQPILQPGNLVDLAWRARLEEHLGTFQVEPLQLNSSRFLNSATAVYGIQTLASHLRLLPERDPNAGLFEALGLVIEHLEEPSIGAVLMARFELGVLEQLGFGLDLGSCALTGSREELAFVSPKSGRAVTAAAGDPWKDKLLPLPTLLTSSKSGPSREDDIRHCFALTGHFLDLHVYGPRASREPEARSSYIGSVVKALQNAGD